MKRRRVAQDTRVFSDVISNGLYIVLEWIPHERNVGWVDQQTATSGFKLHAGHVVAVQCRQHI